MLFPVLNIEERLQVGDKSRFDASKCFATNGESDVTTVTVTPGMDGAAVSVYDINNQDNWYLDWMFSDWTFDVVAGYNDAIDFDMGGAKVAYLTEGTYSSLATLAFEIATRLNAVAGVSGTFSITIDYKNRLTISNDSASFQLLPETGVNRDTQALKHIGYRKDADGSSILGRPVEYSIKQVELTIDNGTTPQSVLEYVHLYSLNGDSLFSADTDLITWEPDVMKWVKPGRASFLDLHREAQDQILYWLDKEGYVNVYNEKYTKFDVVDHSEVHEWSLFKVLEIVMWSASNKSDDVFLKRHFEYKKKAEDARNRAVLRLDVDDDGVVNIGEQVDVKFGVRVTR